MKKFAFILCFILISLLRANAQEPQYVSKEQQNRNVLIEEFTGRKCVNCPLGHVQAKVIEEAYPERVWAINLHGGYYSSLDYPNLNTAICDTIGMYFNPMSFPSAIVNRQTASPLTNYNTQWRPAVDEQVAQPAEVNVAGQVAINPVTRVATVTVELYYTANSASDVNYLNVFMLQDSIVGSQTGAGSNPDQAIGTEGDYLHMHVLRDNVTPFWGDEIKTTTKDSFVTKTYEYEIPKVIGDPNGVDVILENLSFIAFVTEKYQGAGTRPIINVNKLHTLIATDESVLPYLTEVKPKYAVECSNNKTFEIVVQNTGKEDITSIKFELSVDNRNPIEYVWEGNIPSNQTQIIDKDLRISLGEHTVTVKILEANGRKFDIEKETTVIGEEWTDVAIEGEQEEFTIEVAQDKYGNQTTWELVASDHTVLTSGGPYGTLLSGTGTKVHTEKITLSSGDCVRFVINDQIGDGICCTYGEGYYKIIDSKGNVIVDGDGAFGSQASHVLSVMNEGDIVIEPEFVSTEVMKRNVIIEEFTGRNCPNCPNGHLISSGIAKDNPGRVWSMGVHSGYFTPNTYPNFQTDISATFMDPYDDVEGGLGLPAAVINRMTDEAISRSQWKEVAEGILKDTAECNVAGHVVIDPITRVATITAEVYYTANSNDSTNYLTIVMLQDSIVGQQAHAETNPEQHLDGDQYVHMHVLRDVITADWGDEIAPTTQGSLIKKSYEYQIPEIIGDTNGVIVDLDNISFLAFVTEKYQGISTKPILNANKLTVEQNTNESVSPYIVEVIEESGIFCSNDRTFKTYIKNVGTSELTSVKFNTFINGSDKKEHTWTGNLKPNEEARFDIELELPFGDNEVKIKIVEANDTKFTYERIVEAICDEWATVEMPSVDKIKLTIEVVQDKYGSHTTWEFLSSDNTVLASGGPYKYIQEADTMMHKHTVTVEEDCYKFVIYDSFKNGICCESGDGYYRIVDELGRVVVDGNGDFGEMAYNIISVTEGASVGEMSASMYNVYPNPVKDILTIKGENIKQIMIFNSLGQIVRKMDCNDNTVKVNVETLQNGMYFVNIIDGNGDVRTSKVSVMR